MCSQDDHVRKKYFENGLRKKRVLREIPWFGYFYFLENERGHYIPFLKDFFYKIEIHLEVF
jgi:hypothetical protein